RALRLVAGHAGGLLELLPDAVDQLLVLALAVPDRLLALLEGAFLLRQRGIALLEALQLPVDRFLLLRHPLLQGGDLAPLLARVPLPLGPRLEDDVLGLDIRLLPHRLSLFTRLLHDAGTRLVGAGLELHGALAANTVEHEYRPGTQDDPEQGPQHRHDDVSLLTPAVP